MTAMTTGSILPEGGGEAVENIQSEYNTELVKDWGVGREGWNRRHRHRTSGGCVTKGKYPKKFEEKYKELQPEKYQDTIEHVIRKEIRRRECISRLW